MGILGKKALFLIFLLGLIGLSLALLVYLKKPEEQAKVLPSPLPPSPTPLGEKVSLSLLPSSTWVKMGQTFSVEIVLDTGKRKVDAADVFLEYDPQTLKVERVLTGDFFDQFPVVASESGRIQISALVSPQEEGPRTISGRGKVGVVVFKGVSPGEAVVRFSPDCLVATAGNNILEKTTGGSI